MKKKSIVLHRGKSMDHNTSYELIWMTFSDICSIDILHQIKALSYNEVPVKWTCYYQGPLLLTWFNFNLSMDK